MMSQEFKKLKDLVRSRKITMGIKIKQLISTTINREQSMEANKANNAISASSSDDRHNRHKHENCLI